MHLEAMMALGNPALQGGQILGDQLMLTVLCLLGDGRSAEPPPPQISHIDLITVAGQKTGQPLARFGIENPRILDGAVHHQDRLSMHGDPGFDVAHMQLMGATGDKQRLLQQFHFYWFPP